MAISKDINHMKYKGILVGTRSYNNISLDILRSGLGKYILTNNKEKSIWCAIELFLFDLINIKPIRTNLVNKLFLIYINNFSLKNINILLKLDEFFINLENGEEDKVSLYKIIDILCSCEQDNTIMVITSIFSNMIYKNNLVNHDLIKYKIDLENRDEISDYTPGDYWIYKNDKDPDDLVKFMDYLIFYIDNNSIKAIYWLFKIGELTKNKIKASKRYRRYKPIYAVWEHLFIRAENEHTIDFPITKYINICYKYFTKINENIDILAMAIFMFIRKLNYTDSSEDKELDIVYLEGIFKRNLDKQVIDFDPYCFDKNVKEGRYLIKNLNENVSNQEIYDMDGIDDNLINLFRICNTATREKKKVVKKTKLPIIELQEDKIPGIENSEAEIVNDKAKDIINFMETLLDK